jgi:hypothetical protein
VSVLTGRLLAIHDALEGAGVPHAFGGAIALAYCTNEPRGTRDVDVNVFVDVGEVERVLAALPPDVAHDATTESLVRRDGQVRLWWEDTPVDLFFDVHEFHRQVPFGIRMVPFVSAAIPVLGCTDLVVFKVMFNRTKHWADIEEMIEADAVDATSALGWVARLLGPEHQAAARLAALLSPSD